jgi:hypothetical protein
VSPEFTFYVSRFTQYVFETWQSRAFSVTFLRDCLPTIHRNHECRGVAGDSNFLHLGSGASLFFRRYASSPGDAARVLFSGSDLGGGHEPLLCSYDGLRSSSVASFPGGMALYGPAAAQVFLRAGGGIVHSDAYWESCNSAQFGAPESQSLYRRASCGTRIGRETFPGFARHGHPFERADNGRFGGLRFPRFQHVGYPTVYATRTISRLTNQFRG